MFYRFSSRKSIGVVGGGYSTESKCIEGIVSVNMLIAKVSVSICVARGISVDGIWRHNQLSPPESSVGRLGLSLVRGNLALIARIFVSAASNDERRQQSKAKGFR